MMYQKLQALLPQFTVEPVTPENLSLYETVFYNNQEYYCLTDGHPATKETCEDSIDGYLDYPTYSIGICHNEQSVAFLSVLDGYPEEGTLYIGLLLVDDRFQHRAIGSSIIQALFKVATDLNFKNLQLSVQENNISGLSFWKKIGFYEIDRCPCEGFDNLSMKYDL